MLWAGSDRGTSVQGRPVAIVNLALLLELVVAVLPPGAEDEIVLIEHLPGRRVHLQDFFWTGVEDAPSWLDPNQILTLYETHTIHHTATVYVPEDLARPENSDMDTRKPSNCTSCIDPTPTLLGEVDQNIGVLIGNDPGPRYWLLTVLKAGESVPSKIELRLAKLYKTAFTRQQQRHLGLLPEIQPRKNFPKREIDTSRNHTREIQEMMDATRKPLEESLQTNESQDWLSPGVSLLRMRPLRIAKTRRALQVPQPEYEPWNRTRPRSQVEPDVGLVQVRMQNTSLTEFGTTRLIYTVHLGGKPVPAESAAKDMALLTAQEVALELGAPVLIQSEPYLKESRPLALSRKRDAWVLIGATSAGLFLLLFIVVVFLLVTKSKRDQSRVPVPPNGRIVVKDEEHAETTPGIDNNAYVFDTESRTEVTIGQRRVTPGNLSTTPRSHDTVDASARDVSTENEMENEQRRRQEQATPWNTKNYAEIDGAGVYGRHAQRRNAIDRSESFGSFDSSIVGADDDKKTLDSPKRGFYSKKIKKKEERKEEEEEEEEEEESPDSPNSYLSMPSCKQFPNIKSVEPLSKVLEPGIVKRLEMEFDSPEKRGSNNFTKENTDHFFSRASSATKDPGVLGPIVWDLKRKRAVEGNGALAASDLESGLVPRGPVGRARRRFNEFLEDSFNLFGSREAKHCQGFTHRQEQEQQESLPQSATQSQRHYLLPENRGKSAQVSHVVSPDSEDSLRPRTSLPRNDIEESIPETGLMGPHPRGVWGSRPLSAGPFHRPTLPEVDVTRIFANSQLRPEDPAVPLIAAIKKELRKFNYE